MAVICGKTQMSRHEAVQGFWNYIEKHKLQDPNQKRMILCDEKLKDLLPKRIKLPYSDVLTCLTQNMESIHPAKQHQNEKENCYYPTQFMKCLEKRK